MVRSSRSTPRAAVALVASAALLVALLGASPQSAGAVEFATGPGASIGFRLFPPDNPWNTDVSALPVQRDSSVYLASIGLTTGLHPDFGTVWDGAPIGIPYVTVRGTQPKMPISFYYAEESDPGPYPIPLDAPIEGGSASTGDRHVLVLDVDNRVLYEVFDAHYNSAQGRWEAGSGAIWDLSTNTLRPAGWTSADAAGLPILPGLVRYDEVAVGEITHALRFTVPRTQRAYVYPARHFASGSTDPSLPPMGLRVRLKAGYDVSGFPPEVQVILRALKKYGMIVADNGSPWYVSGAPDPRWNDDALRALARVKGSDFEVVDTAGTETLARPGGGTPPPASEPSAAPTPASDPAAPVLRLGANARVRVRRVFSRWGRVSENGSATWSATVNYGDGTGTKRFTLATDRRFRLKHSYRRPGLYRITVRVRDSAGRTGVAKIKVSVRR